MVKIMDVLGLDYNPAISATKAFENRIASLNKQLLQMKSLAAQSAKDINNTFSSTLGVMGGNKTILGQYGNPLKSIQTEAVKAKKTIEDIGSTSITPMKVPKPDDGEFNVWESEMKRRISWFTTGGLFYGTISAAKEAVKAISEVEMGMVEIARVMEDSSFVFNEYRDELLQLGVDYGQSFDVVQDIALRWAQAGYGVSDSLENTKSSLLALNTAELDAKNATESLIGIMAQWKMTSAELPLLLDKINKTADDFTLTSQDLVDGLLRSSGAAKIMGLSLDETISLLTIMREASGRTGQEVGNALNSILSYIQRPSSIRMMESLGIDMFADEAKTQFRNVMEVFQEVAVRWDTASDQIRDGFVQAADDAGLFSEELATALGLQQQWDDLQQRDIAQASAGVYRRNYYIGMIERLSEAQNVLNGLTDAAGYSQAENARTMDTLQKKYEGLKTAATQLAVSLGDSGLLEVFKGLLDIGTGVLQMFTKLPKPVQDGVLAFTAMFAVLKAGQAAINTFNLATGATATTSKAAAAGMTEMAAAATATAAATNTATAASKGFMAANKWLLIISAAVSAISMIAGAVGRYKEEQEKLIETTKQDIKILEEQKQGLAELAQEYETLKEKERNLTATEEEKQRLLEVQKELVELYGVSATGVDAEGRAFADSIEVIKLRTAALKEQFEIQQKLLESKSKEKDDERISKITALTDQRNYITKRIKELESYMAELDAYIQGGSPTDYIQKEIIDFYDDPVARAKELLQAASDYVSGYIPKLKELRDEIEEITEDNRDFLANEADSLIRDMHSKGDDLSSAAKAFVMSFADALADQPLTTNAQKEALQAFVDEIVASNLDELTQKYNSAAEIFDTAGMEEASKGIQKIIDNIVSLHPELEEAATVIATSWQDVVTRSEAATGSLDRFGKTVEEIREKSNALNSEVKNLNQIMYDLQRGQELSAEQVFELIDKYPKLAQYIIKVGDAYKFEESALDVLREAKINEQKAALDAEATKTAATITETHKRLTAYGVEVSAIHDLKTARSEYQKLGLLSPNMGYEAFTRTMQGAGLHNPFASEYEYQQAVAAGKQLLELGSLYESIEAKKKLLEDGMYGVTVPKSSGSPSNKALAEALKILDHQKRIGQLTTEQEISRLKEIEATYQMSADERMNIIERIYDAEQRLIKETEEAEKTALDERKKKREEFSDYYKKTITDIQDQLKNAYEERIGLIDQEIDKIDEQIKQLNRAEEARDHDQTIADLQDELAYWSVRTSEQARKKVKETQEKIAEEQHKRAVELQKQELEDKKDILEDEKRQWQSALNEMLDAFKGNNADIVASARINSKAAYEEWYNNYIVPMQQALQQGDLLGFQLGAGALQGSIDTLPSHDWGMTETDYQEFISNGMRWQELRAAGANAEELKALNAKNDALRIKYGRDPALGEYPVFHGGGKVLDDGKLIAQKGELIFPPNLSAVMERFIEAVRFGGSHVSTSSTSYDNRRETKIDKVLHIEHYHQEDDTDTEILARSLKRTLSAF